MGISQGLLASDWMLLRMKLKKQDNCEKRMRFVYGRLTKVRRLGKERVSSGVTLPINLSPKA